MKIKLVAIIYLTAGINAQNIHQDKIVFTSANPFSFKDIITDLDNQESQEVFGNLTFPEYASEEDTTKYPLVMGIAGSLGWAEHHLEYLKMYREMGIATFEVNSFKSRQVESTVGTQVEVTTATMVLDSYKAFEKLSVHPRINKEKVAITGWSLGGGVALLSGWLPAKQAIDIDLTFAAHLSIYPPCIVEPEILDFTDSPIHILIGELDNWVPADACVDLVSKIRAHGSENIAVTVYENSHHSFDRDGPVIVDKKGYILTDCRLKMRADGAVLMNFLDIPMTTPLLQKIGLAFCAERGPSYGGNPEAREKAFQFAREFMGQHLLPDN